MRLAFTISKYNPELDAAPHDETYRLDITRGMTVLDALIRIKDEQDGRLTFRYSCRSAICGSCAMTINGAEKLACRTAVRREWERHGGITIEPLRNLPVLKDLAVDMRSFWGKVRAIDPWVQADSAVAGGSAQFHNVDACIMCGACVAACTV
ncbi:MAG TPA: 2Fe-2S iron-sulfur cluster-binding protein, partial [Nitrospirales bacterium]